MLTKYCRCGKRIPRTDRCCSDCVGYYKKQDDKHQRKYDNTKRVNADFYNSAEWGRLRALALSKSNGLDLYEYYINKAIVKADTVHHIVEIKEDYSRRLDITNLIPLSSKNHSKIHRMYFKRKRETQQLLLDLLKRAEFQIKYIGGF